MSTPEEELNPCPNCDGTKVIEVYASMDPAARLIEECCPACHRTGYQKNDLQPDFMGVPKRKLDQLLAEGFRVTGFAIERRFDGTEPLHGFITTSGLVGWWTPGMQALECAHVAMEALRVRCEQAEAAIDAAQAVERERDELRAQISAIHHAIKDAGWHPGRTDDLLTDIIRRKGDELAGLRAQVEALSKSQEPVHWRAILAADQVPHQLKTSMHIVGFRNKGSADQFVAEQLDFQGWRYTLEPLYAHPAPHPSLTRPAVQEGWRELAAQVMDALAEAQEQTNSSYPDHVKCYPQWVSHARWCRWHAEMFRTGKPIGNGAGNTKVLEALGRTDPMQDQ